MDSTTASLWQRLAFMFAVAGMAALAVFWVVLPVLDIWSGQDRGISITTSGGTPKGDFQVQLALKTDFERHRFRQTTVHPEVSPKGNFLGWFPDTDNMELEFRIAQPEKPMKFVTPKYTFPSVMDQATTRLVAFANAPFPFNGREPRSNRPFLTYKNNKKVHITGRGAVYNASSTFGDPRALLHIPKGFDIEKPGVIVVFYHGHGATLRRDVYRRQRVPHQISESGVNAVLVAPQFAVDARNSAAGKLWEPGGLKRFLDEVAVQLGEEHGADGAEDIFAKMPVVIVAYSGGFEPAGWSVSRGGLGSRLKGLVLLDALYGHVDRFASWLDSNRSAFLIDAYAGGSPKRNSEKLKAVLRDKGITYSTSLPRKLKPGSVTILSAVTSHHSYVTKAWTKSPIADMLRRIRPIIEDPAPDLRKIAAR